MWRPSISVVDCPPSGNSLAEALPSVVHNCMFSLPPFSGEYWQRHYPLPVSAVCQNPRYDVSGTHVWHQQFCRIWLLRPQPAVNGIKGSSVEEHPFLSPPLFCVSLFPSISPSPPIWISPEFWFCWWSSAYWATVCTAFRGKKGKRVKREGRVVAKTDTAGNC